MKIVFCSFNEWNSGGGSGGTVAAARRGRAVRAAAAALGPVATMTSYRPPHAE